MFTPVTLLRRRGRTLYVLSSLLGMCSSTTLGISSSSTSCLSSNYSSLCSESFASARSRASTEACNTEDMRL